MIPLLILGAVVFYLGADKAAAKLTGEAPPNPAAQPSAEQKAKDDWNAKGSTRGNGLNPTKSAISAEQEAKNMWNSLHGEGEPRSRTPNAGRVGNG